MYKISIDSLVYVNWIKELGKSSDYIAVIRVNEHFVIHKQMEKEKENRLIPLDIVWIQKHEEKPTLLSIMNDSMLKWAALINTLH